MAPFVRIEGSGGYTNFKQEVQDGGWGRGEVTIGKRLTQRLAVSASYFLDHFEGRIRVFQRTSNNLAVRASFDVTNKTQLTASYELGARMGSGGADGVASIYLTFEICD